MKLEAEDIEVDDDYEMPATFPTLLDFPKREPGWLPGLVTSGCVGDDVAFI